PGARRTDRPPDSTDTDAASHELVPTSVREFADVMYVQPPDEERHAHPESPALCTMVLSAGNRLTSVWLAPDAQTTPNAYGTRIVMSRAAAEATAPLPSSIRMSVRMMFRADRAVLRASLIPSSTR